MSTASAPQPSLDLAEPTDIHLIAIGGAGMAAIAELLHGMGHTVRGSDMSDSASMERLRSLGIEAIVGHDVANIGTPTVAMKSTAVPESNVEVVALEERGVCLLYTSPSPRDQRGSRMPSSA